MRKNKKLAVSRYQQGHLAQLIANNLDEILIEPEGGSKFTLRVLEDGTIRILFQNAWHVISPANASNVVHIMPVPFDHRLTIEPRDGDE